MLEAYKVGERQQGLGQKLRSFMVDGIKTVAIKPDEKIDVIVANSNVDGTTSVVHIAVDDTPQGVAMLEYGMIQRLQFRNNEDNGSKKTVPSQHVYDKTCLSCLQGEGHIIRIDNLATGEQNQNLLRMLPWENFVSKVAEKLSSEMLSIDSIRFDVGYGIGA